MSGYVTRITRNKIEELLSYFPIVAIIGPRQCGKSTLAKNILKSRPNSLYLDLESEKDRLKLDSPHEFFDANPDITICLDEIQEAPNIFKELRSIIDRDKVPGRCLILGSASIDLLKQSGETLAGRIAYIELNPFSILEAPAITRTELWLRGGFPDSVLAPTESLSLTWRENFIRTFLERDIPKHGFNVPHQQMNRFWKMCAHSHGQVFNKSTLGNSLDVSYHTIQRYADMLESTFMITIVHPYSSNTKKRITKSPLLYVRDSGILHSLLDIHNFNDLLSHPIYGKSWEGFVLEQVTSCLPDWTPYFYRTQGGAEIDFILEKGTQKIAIECKASSAPKPSKGFYQSAKDLDITERYCVAPINDEYPLKHNTTATSIEALIKKLS